MRTDEQTIERQTELFEFCEMVEQDREDNDENAEHERTKDLKSNPDSEEYKAACRTLAETTGGRNFDNY
jgi:hypothetical protein